MIEYLMLATLSMPNINVEDLERECYIKAIVYDGKHSYVHTVGACSAIYNKCIEDACNIEKVPEEKDLNFGRKHVGLLYEDN